VLFVLYKRIFILQLIQTKTPLALTDSSLATSWQQQLNFVYENSPYVEPDYLRYPVFRIEQ